MIKVQNISAGYGSQRILQELTFSIPKQKITCVIGPNGCGKSTLLQCLGNHLPLQEGTIAIEDRMLSSFSPKDLAKRITYLSQSRKIPQVTVEDLVFYGRYPYLGYPRKFSSEDREIVCQAMEQTGVFSWRSKMLDELSGGERQKVYLAMALAQHTDILLLDEPTTFLDMRHQLELLELLTLLKNKGKTIVVVLHDLTQAVQLADQICLLQDGKLVFCGEADSLLGSSLLEEVFSLHVDVIEISQKKQLLFSL